MRTLESSSRAHFLCLSAASAFSFASLVVSFFASLRVRRSSARAAASASLASSALAASAASSSRLRVSAATARAASLMRSSLCLRL